MTDREYLVHAYKGNLDAARLALTIVKIADVWDNLIDKDKEVSDADIHEAFWLSCIEMQQNPFFRQFSADLLPVMANGIVNWRIANELQKQKDDRAIEIAHVIRYSIADTIVHMALLIGGPEWVVEVGPELRLRSQKDTLKNFRKEVANENKV